MSLRLSKLINQLSPTNTSSTTPKLLSQLHPNAASQLKNILQDRYTEDEKILNKHGREVIGYNRSSPPLAVIFPLTTLEISNIVKICNNHSPSISIIPYSAGSSLESHIISPNSITMSFAKMNKILKVYSSDMQCIVQPGVNWVKLNKELKQYNLFIGVDPAPAACIGGMIGTSCSGPSALKYGTMTNQIINLTIVLSNGKILKTGQRAVKSVAGYDLNSLFCGSEGTLGIITEATIKLRPIPNYIEIGLSMYDNISDVGKCVSTVMQSGISLGAFEYIDPNMVNSLIKFDKKVKILKSNKHIILFKFVGSTKEHINADIKLIKNIVKQYTKYEFLWSSNDEERERLWHVRKMAFWASKFANPGKECFVTDVAVPVNNFGKHLVKCKNEIDKYINNKLLSVDIVGHIGDGNWHACMFFDKNNIKQVNTAKELNKFIVYTALELDGTCTAEHGVGKGKKKYLVKELGQNTVDLMKVIKKGIDPKNILAPGNIVDI